MDEGKVSQAGRLLAFYQKRKLTACATCGKERQMRKGQRYCSTSCRVRAWQKQKIYANDDVMEQKNADAGVKHGVAAANAVED